MNQQIPVILLWRVSDLRGGDPISTQLHRPFTHNSCNGLQSSKQVPAKWHLSSPSGSKQLNCRIAFAVRPHFSGAESCY